MRGVRRLDRDTASVPSPGASPGVPERIWYAAYGSNMHTARLRCYIEGGRPPGAARTYPGCRDRRPPARTVSLELPGVLYFATESRVWTGGRAFYDPAGAPGGGSAGDPFGDRAGLRGPTGVVLARAHLLTGGQFSDIAAQEMYESPGRDLDLRPVLRDGRDERGPGRYETLVCPGVLEGIPVVTFTAPWRHTEVAWNAPSAAYLEHLAAGLLAGRDWGVRSVAAYLSRAPGVGGAWTPGEIEALVATLG
ncbi:histone deacetylase [Streptomyces sp. NPDC057638]|uniref:histone deacetylase n=1 Tax=Streptomyces sp. NPDC057638 TaxID=3346190 RepID=UPI0036A13CA5